MSGGSQHNPNGRQSQLSSGWSPLQLQMANYLARAPQAHMASERGVTWHTPTPPHLYHVPSPPDPLQAMKASASAGNSVFRHTATPPELYRHTPTPPEKHHMRHTPSPSDHKGGAALPPAELYPHLGPARDKLMRPEDMMPYARGVDLSVSRGAAGGGGAGPANGAPIALSVRDAPTINSLIARAQPRPAHSRVDSLLERLVPSPVSPHSVIVHSRAGPTPSPPSSNEDSADSCGAPPGSKRKRKPERTVRVPSVPPPPEALAFSKPQLPDPPAEPPKPEHARLSPPEEAEPAPDPPLENGEATHRNGPELPAETAPPEAPHTRRKRRSRSAETIDDIAAMIAGTDNADGKDLEPEIVPDKPAVIEAMEVDAPVTIDKLKSVLASPEQKSEEEPKSSPSREDGQPEVSVVEAAAAPRRRSARTSNSESTNVPVESPSEAKPAEPETSGAKSAEPTPASIVDVEDQLEKMFAGIEAEPESGQPKAAGPKGKKRRKSAAAKSDKKVSRRSSRASTGDEGSKKKGGKKKGAPKQKKASEGVKDAYAYDSGSNASSGRSRGPYIQIRGPRDSPLSVSVMNAAAGEEDCEAAASRRKPDADFRNGLRSRGLHCSTLGLRYDAITPDATWVCVFCEKGPHAAAGGAPLGDLFGPYAVATDCEEFRALDEATRSKYDTPTVEVWFHEDCGVWAPGLVAGGARVWGLPGAVWGAAGAACARCGRPGAGLACARRGCPARAHLPCARALAWALEPDRYRATCPRHA